MSKIHNQILVLQEKKKKIDYISYIADLLKNDKHCVDYIGIKDEVLSQIEPLLIELIESIENDVPFNKSQPSSEFTPTELSAIKLLAAKVIEKQQDAKPSTPAPSPFENTAAPAPPPKKPIASHS